METLELDPFTITIDKEGSREYAKVSYPIRYGCFSEIKSPEYVIQYNLNGEIKFIQGRTQSWPHPAEWLMDGRRKPKGDMIREFNEVKKRTRLPTFMYLIQRL
ncbi:MAG: hypothetical protein JRF35_03065 [Deltaproteobacteria bacterium]|nr:hypothetical protein [Deltaproteobacteria bacterium]